MKGLNGESDWDSNIVAEWYDLQITVIKHAPF